MAQPPLVTLTNVSLTFGGKPLFSGISLAMGVDSRMCLVGRNGSGKSTLLKMVAGLVLPDSGERFVQPGASIAYLPQDPDLSGFETLRAYAAADCPEAELYRVDRVMEGLKLAGERKPAQASGGERRRAALARVLARDPELLLLDEPTNHLDVEAITWLEQYLRERRGGFVLISHDRAFLRALARTTLWLDRGELRRNEGGFEQFEEWRDRVWAEEDLQRHKMDQYLKAEGRWAVEGISARRKRNQGRLRRLQELRRERREQILRRGPAAMVIEAAAPSGKLVVEATQITKQFDGRVILRPFSLRIHRGDRVAFVGANGAGKTTLLKMLIGELTPDSGQIRIGTNLEVAVFDQMRAALDPDKSLWATLTDDKEIGLRSRGDHIDVRGQSKHVVGYLKEFLFDEAQVRGPVSALSGGEKARLLLARLMARPANLLVLDEPTNDLDVETLDLLEELLSDFDGTVLLVSHDRDFIDRIATSTLVFEGGGRVTEYAGGWTDAMAQGAQLLKAQADVSPKAPKAEAAKPAEVTRVSTKLSFKQAHRLAQLPGEIDRLTAEIAKLTEFLADPTLFGRAPAQFEKATAALAERQRLLAAAEEEWLELEMLREQKG